MHWQYIAENIAIYASIVICSITGFWLMENGVGLWSLLMLLFINCSVKQSKK